MIVYISTLVAWICVILMCFVGVASVFIAVLCLGASLEHLVRCLIERRRRARAKAFHDSCPPSCEP